MKLRPIPICLIVGFLGSGKTSLVKEIIGQYREKQLAFVVNEFSSFDVDGIALQREHDNVLCLPGGSVFCKCLAGQFTQTLASLSETLALPDCDGVVVEASGIADPGVAPRMLHDAGLDAMYQLAQVIAVVDPGNIEELLDTLPNTKSQIMTADTIVLNKQDLYDEMRMQQTAHLLRAINTDAHILYGAFCKVTLPLFEKRAKHKTQGDYALCADPNFSTTTATLTTSVDCERLMRATNTLRHCLYRAKGFLRTPQGPVYLDWTPTSSSCFELPDYPGPFGMTFIGAGAQASAIRALATRLQSGGFSSTA